MIRIPYGKTIAIWAALAVAALLLPLVLTHARPAKARPAGRPKPSGVTSAPVVPGTYATVINVNNLTRSPLNWSWEPSLDGASAPGATTSSTLGPGTTASIGCSDILSALGITSTSWLGGTVQVNTTATPESWSGGQSSLYVAAEMTAELPSGNGMGLSVERIPPIRYTVPAGPSTPPSANWIFTAKFNCGTE